VDDVAAEHRVIGPAQVIYDDEALDMLRVDQVAVLAGLQVEDQEVRILAGSGRTYFLSGALMSYA
jgi:hypothetical protein